MSEKQFTLSWNDLCIDELNDDGKIINGYCPNTQLEKIVDLLNEQQATIDRLKNAICIAYEEKPYPQLEDIKAKYKELDDE